MSIMPGVSKFYREIGALRSFRRYRGSALLIALTSAALGLSVAAFASAQVNVTTQHNDIARTGQNLEETVLNTSSVNSAQFGKLFSQPVVGAIDAQPLYLSRIVVNGATHNVVLVATQPLRLYAFDADSNTQHPYQPSHPLRALTQAPSRSRSAMRSAAPPSISPPMARIRPNPRRYTPVRSV